MAIEKHLWERRVGIPNQSIGQRFQNLHNVTGHTLDDPELLLWPSAQRNEDGETL